MVESDVTTSFYADRAARYAADTEHYQPPRNLSVFAGRLAAGARVLELGCGSGRDSAWMLAAGIDVYPTDGVAEMAAEASVRLGLPVAVLPFDQIEAEASFDGIWANACLLHVPRSDLGGVLQRIHRALLPGGLFYASYKAGEAEGFDGFGRYFNYPDETWLRHAYGQGWTSIDIASADGSGYDGAETRWLNVFARA